MYLLTTSVNAKTLSLSSFLKCVSARNQFDMETKVNNGQMSCIA